MIISIYMVMNLNKVGVCNGYGLKVSGGIFWVFYFLVLLRIFFFFIGFYLWGCVGFLVFLSKFLVSELVEVVGFGFENCGLGGCSILFFFWIGFVEIGCGVCWGCW